MRCLITGGCGFLGSNLSEEVLKRGHELFIFDNLSRVGSSDNLNWLKSKGDFKHYKSDISVYNDVESAIKEVKPDVVFHLAGQVAMTTSISNPRLDFETNVLGGHNLLEAIRLHARNAVVIYSSTNKVYGDLNSLEYFENDTRYIANGYENGFDETLPLSFESPYGCSKGAVDQYMLDYCRIFGLKTIVFRHSSILGGRQYATVDQGWVGWFVKKAIEIKNNFQSDPIVISGSGKQVRDILHSDDLIRCYFNALENIENISGNVFNIGGGIENSLSLLELFNFLESELEIEIQIYKALERPSDQKVFIANSNKAYLSFKWKPLVTKDEALRKMVDWVAST